MFTFNFKKNYREVPPENGQEQQRQGKGRGKGPGIKGFERLFPKFARYRDCFPWKLLLVYDSGGRAGGSLHLRNAQGCDRAGTSF